MCAEYLNVDIMKSKLTNGMEVAIKYVQNLAEKDFKEKVIVIIVIVNNS